jgi:2,3-bisphosphoglycerate-independent phosphoglycerate mutase
MPTTMETARTPFLDGLAQNGELAFLDLQPESGTEDLPNTLIPSSERGILRLLGFPQEEMPPPRATLLSCLFPHGGNDEKSMAVLLNPARYGEDGSLEDYVGDSDSIGRLWSFFDPVQTGDFHFDRESGLRIYPLRDARQKNILRLLLRIPQKLALPVLMEDISPPVLGKKSPRSVFFQWIFEQMRKKMDLSGPLNGFWPWGYGPWHKVCLPSQDGPSPGAMIAGAPIARAIGAFMGLSHPFVPGASGEIATDIKSKMRLAKQHLLDGISRVVVHFEGFDLASHRKKREEKRSFLERFDREAASDLMGLLNSGVVDEVFLTSDHRSDPETGEHAAGPVSLLILRSGGNFEVAGASNGLRFTEALAGKESRWDIARWQKAWNGSGGEIVSWL